MRLVSVERLLLCKEHRSWRQSIRYYNLQNVTSILEANLQKLPVRVVTVDVQLCVGVGGVRKAESNGYISRANRIVPHDTSPCAYLTNEVNEVITLWGRSSPSSLKG